MSVAPPHSSIDLHAESLVIRPWFDPVIDTCGHDAHGRYIELFWVGVLGPSATWLYRRMAAGLAEYPDGYVLELAETAAALGLAVTPGRHSPFTRALQRTVFFGLAHQTDDGLRVRRKVPPLSRRQTDRLPEHLRAAHPFWVRSPRDVEAAELSRASAIASALLTAGDDFAAVEHRLALLRVEPGVVQRAIDLALGDLRLRAG